MLGYFLNGCYSQLEPELVRELGAEEFMRAEELIDGILGDDEIKGYCLNLESTVQRIFTAAEIHQIILR